MITSKTFRTNISFRVKSQESHPGISNVFAAAVVNQGFRDKLLSDPEAALHEGYLGKPFNLSPEEASLLISINAKSLAGLAKEIVLTLER